MWGLSVREQADWLDALGADSASDAALTLWHWSTTASVVVEEFRAVGKAVSGMKTTDAGEDLRIAAQCMSAVASDLDQARRAFAALAQDGDQS